MDTVVVVAADAARRAALGERLRALGVKVRGRRVDDTLDEVAVDGPDLIIIALDSAADRALDVVLGAPGLDDVPLLAVLPASPEGLARGERTSRLADLCLAPLRDGELELRVRRLLRRPGADGDVLRCGGLTVDLRGYEATIDGTSIDLTYQEFELLKFLASNPGKAFTRDQLLARVWGYDYYGGVRTVDIHVRRVRAKVGSPYAGWIKTIRHVGYKWAPAPPHGGHHG